MTDEEIEKGLYACGIEAKCEKCPYIEDCNKAINLSKDALDYINRLKAENAMLRISDDSKEKCTLASIQPDIFAAMYEAQQAEKRQAYINGQISLFTE